MRSLPSQSATIMANTLNGFQSLGHVHGNEAMDPFGSDKNAYIDALGGARNLASGKHIHCCTIRCKPGPDVVIGDTLLGMYIRCGSIESACRVFELMPIKDVISWNTMISGFAHMGNAIGALNLFSEMQIQNYEPDNVTFVSVLYACACLKNIECGERVYLYLKQARLQSNVFVSNTLITMYSKCGRTDKARKVFDKMQVKNVVSWTAMISAYAEQENIQETFKLFWEMRQHHFRPVQITYVRILHACSQVRCLERGKYVHVQLKKFSLELDAFVASSLVGMYAKCGDIKESCNLFNKIPMLDVVLWNVIISGYLHHGDFKEAVNVFNKMQQGRFNPSRVTYASLLTACGSEGAPAWGKHIHTFTIRSGLNLDVLIGAALVDMYTKCGKIKDANQVFERLPTANLVVWNSLILGHADNRGGKNAFKLFEEMQYSGLKPDAITYVGLLCACVGALTFHWGKWVHAHIINSRVEINAYVGNSLVDTYSKCGSIIDAHKLFLQMGYQSKVSWNAIILGYAIVSDCEMSFKLFQQMQDRGVDPDVVTYLGIICACSNATIGGLEWGKYIHAHIMNVEIQADIYLESALVDMYVKTGSIACACEVFNRASNEDVVPYSVMVLGYLLHRDEKEGLNLFNQMEKLGLKADSVTYISTLGLCANTGALECGRLVHSRCIKDGVDIKLFMANAIVSMYAKCGNIINAFNAFDCMETRSVISWNAMISGCGDHGNGEMALKLFTCMIHEGIQPDDITFVSLLSACSNVNLIDEGISYLISMSEVYGIKAAFEHYECLTELLVRAGFLHEAKDLLDMMPFPSTNVSWTSLLASCRTYCNSASRKG